VLQGCIPSCPKHDHQKPNFKNKDTQNLRTLAT
jgi:hypothetical protein